MEKKKNYFKYIVIFAVLMIPFMYGFFYLKAYWNPYGEGNIDNIPVAIINSDEGDKGTKLIESIKDKKKLKLIVVDEEDATDGLYNGEYYAVINIPKDFTSNMESAGTTNKIHATITYSPNQKSNYLASQIINNVVTVVEKNLDNQVNSTIVGNLEETVESVPDKLDTISEGFGTLKEGTSTLNEGSKKITLATATLEEKYAQFNKGVKTIKEGTDKLNEATQSFNTLNSSIDELTTGVSTLKAGSDEYTSKLDGYTNGVNTALTYEQYFVNYVNAAVCPKVTAGIASADEVNLCKMAQGLNTPNPNYGGLNTISYLKASGSKLNESNKTINGGINLLNTKAAGFSTAKDKLGQLQAGINELNTGANTLYSSSLQIQSGISTLNSGANTLSNGVNTLDTKVAEAKTELDSNISETKEEVKKVNGLKEYSEEPVKVDTEVVNEITSYGTAFSPLFISIALWVGCLMMFIVLYYDKKERFGILLNTSKEYVKRTLCYHGLATISAFLFALSLQLFLDFNITNVFLYYACLILVANTFMAIIEFLIKHFDDIGKFIGLIILVLQLAASGGTFPIETVTKGFRWMHNILPMTYTIKLLREPLVSIESNLLSKNLIVVIIMFVVFFTINITTDILSQRKDK